MRLLNESELRQVSGGEGADQPTYSEQAAAQAVNYYGAFDNGFPDAYVNMPLADALAIVSGMNGSDATPGTTFGNDFGDNNAGPADNASEGVPA